jgi:hypothetical protein
VRTHEAKKMTSVDLIYPAIFIFGMLIVGLILTVIEFNKFETGDDEKDAGQRLKDK